MGGKPVELQGRLLLFWNFFLSGKEKSGTFSLIKGENLIKSPVCAQRKNSLFDIRFSDYLSNFPSGKNFIFFPLDESCIYD